MTDRLDPQLAALNLRRDFQDEIGRIVDLYLKRGVPPDRIAEGLRNEASNDLIARLQELQAGYD